MREKEGRSAAGDAWSFRIFVVGRTATHSSRAIKDVRRALDHHIPNGYHFEVVDLQEQPEMAAREQLIVLPSVIRKSPAPEVRLTGSFSDEARVAQAFGLSPAHNIDPDQRGAQRG